MAGIDINRGTSGVNLPKELSAEIWQKAQEASAVMALSNVVNLPGAGVTVDVVTGDPTPEWVAETDEKPVSRGTVTSKTMQGYTLAVIVPFSNQFRRDKTALYNVFVQRLPGVLAKKIDETIFYGTAPGSNFDVLTSAAEVSLLPTTTPATDAYDHLVDAEVAIAEAGYALNGYAISARGVGILRKIRDANGYPLLGGLNGFDNLLGLPIRRTQAVQKITEDQADLVGVAGDWSTATFGVVQNVNVSVSTEASIVDGATTLNLWQRNMFAVRAEMEVGFRIQDIAAFRKITGAVTNLVA